MRFLIAIAVCLVAGPALAEMEQCEPAGAAPIPEIAGRYDYIGARGFLLFKGFKADSVNSEVSPTGDFRTGFLPEVETCSSEGYCRMQFTDPSGNKLRIVTNNAMVEGAFYVCELSN